MKNKEVALILYKIADYLDFLGVEFKPIAFRRAAQNVEVLSKDIEEIHKEGKLEEIPAVGINIAQKIAEYLNTGKLEYLEELKSKIPVNLEELMSISEVGPKRIKVLYQNLKIKNLADLKKAVQEHKVRDLFGFGEKSENSILRSIELLEKSKGRKLLGDCIDIGEQIVEKLNKVYGVTRVDLAGSARRMKETVGDLDILVISSKPNKVVEAFTSLKNIQKVLEKGPTRSSIILDNGLQVDLRVVEKRSYGAALNYFTGNKEHNIMLRKIAIKKGLKLSEYGLFKGNKFVGGRTEEELYKKLGMVYIEPELRENTGEIELAQKNKLPKIIEYNDILGDLHMHTTFSDGHNSIEEMALAAKKIGYLYVNISDHSNLPVANGMDDKKVLDYCKEIDGINKKNLGINIFKGCEINIDKKGEPDLKKSTIKELDIPIFSIHSYFKLDKGEMTKRILTALDNEFIKILAHPTGRLINQREEYEFDFDAVFEKAAKNNVVLEINSFPDRLDLKDFYIKAARELKVKFVVDTDSHAVSHLKLIRFGIGQARRGWLTKKDVLNTLNLKEFRKVMKL